MIPSTVAIAATVAAIVGDDVVTAAEVEHRVSQLRASKYSSALPTAGSAEGRNLRRWTVQLLVAERIISLEAETRGLNDSDQTEVSAPLTLSGAMETGGVGAVMLACSSKARALRASMSNEIQVSDADVVAYYQRNLDRWRLPERRWVSRLEGERVVPLGSFRPGELIGPMAEAIFSSAPGTDTATMQSPGGRWAFRIDRFEPSRLVPFSEARGVLFDELSALATTRAFCSWLDLAYRRLVRLQPGFEHPGDPAQPDAAHRH